MTMHPKAAAGAAEPLVYLARAAAVVGGITLDVGDALLIVAGEVIYRHRTGLAPATVAAAAEAGLLTLLPSRADVVSLPAHRLMHTPRGRF